MNTKPTLAQLREHVRWDAMEIATVSTLLIPILNLDDLRVLGAREPGARYLRSHFARHLALLTMRLHDDVIKVGRSGFTASIASVLQHAVCEGRLSEDKAAQLSSEREGLKATLEANGIPFHRLRAFRDTELAHSLHPHVESPEPLPVGSFLPFSYGTFDLVVEMETLLDASCQTTGASQIKEKEAQWQDQGPAFWGLLEESDDFDF